MPDAIATRRFKVDGREVGCRSYRPEEDGGSYVCHYEIGWPEGARSGRAGGVDEVQALLLAMVKAHTDLLEARHTGKRRISWLDDASLGLPVASVLRDWAPDGRL